MTLSKSPCASQTYRETPRKFNVGASDISQGAYEGRRVAEIVRVAQTKRPDRGRAIFFARVVVLGFVAGFSQRIRPVLPLLTVSKAPLALDRFLLAVDEELEALLSHESRTVGLTGTLGTEGRNHCWRNNGRLLGWRRRGRDGRRNFG